MGLPFAPSHGNLLGVVATALFISISGGVSSARAATPEDTVSALRISGTITGGTLPTNSPEFMTMVQQVSTGDFYGAALTASQSKQGAHYLLRRLAFQMQNASFQAAGVTDNDATVFLIAHFLGAGGPLTNTPSLSKIFSDNVTCLIGNVLQNGVPTTMHIGDMNNLERSRIDWKNDLVCTAGQRAVDRIATAAAQAAAPDPNVAVPNILTTIPLKHVGGFMTLSDRRNDTSFAQVGTAAGTNLRYIANMWLVATGMDILDFASTDARVQNVPRFVPANDPNFLSGLGQTACISCHGGGLVSVDHGYATVADLFDFDRSRGFSYISAPTIASMKSLGSNPSATARQRTLQCTDPVNVACNSDSAGVGTTNSWDIGSTWGARGLLTKMAWNGPTMGQGLNALGTALGKAGIVYSNFVKRIVLEVCPLGVIPDSDRANIVSALQNTDDVKVAIALVVSNPACR